MIYVHVRKAGLAAAACGALRPAIGPDGIAPALWRTTCAVADTHAEDQVPAPDWPTCSHVEGDDICTGKQADGGFDKCLAHLKPDQLDQAMQRLHPGADLDASGTPINADLLDRILSAVQSDDEPPTLGQVSFNQAHFTADANFIGVMFTGDARFDNAQFTGDARFDNAQFAGAAWFDSAQFTGDAWFDNAQFTGDARFDSAQFAGAASFVNAQFAEETLFYRAQFTGEASFVSAQFTGEASFYSAQFTGHALFFMAQFTGDALFARAQFTGHARFDEVRFEKATLLGPLAAGSVNLDWAVFGRPVVIEATATAISCHEATWSAGVTMRLRYAAVDLERATFSVPSFVTGADQPLASSSEPLNEDEVRNHVLGERGESLELWVPIIESLRGSDAANLSITDVDLSRCAFAGARLLDQLRLEGRCVFDHPPRRVRTGWAWLPVWRWSSRQSIAEERAWRANKTRKHAGWRDSSAAESADVGPERLAGLYRQLRKAQEDAKNEPGAADFYYGEMEMRRHSTTTASGERVILWLYWLISGYGLRALRSLLALLVLGGIVTAALAGWGLAATAPPQDLTGTVTNSAGNHSRIDATLSTAKPQLPPAGQRWTAGRARTALEVALDSVVFRTTSQPLTTLGSWITIVARILGPVLLALTLLAVRNRVKR